MRKCVACFENAGESLHAYSFSFVHAASSSIDSSDTAYTLMFFGEAGPAAANTPTCVNTYGAFSTMSITPFVAVAKLSAVRGLLSNNTLALAPSGYVFDSVIDSIASSAKPVAVSSEAKPHVS